MSGLNETPNPKEWWDQFPTKLRLIATGRLWASIGAGGVLYLSPLLFNDLGFSGSQIGSGITIAAIFGTISRLITGILLDKGIRYTKLLKIAALVAILSDLFLFNANNFNTFIKGQCLLGTAAGIYWPSIELAVPINCQNYPSSKGFALVRTSDALGISIGSVIGTISSSLSTIRIIYIVDIICMIILLKLIRNDIGLRIPKLENINQDKDKNSIINFSFEKQKWFKSIFSIIIITLFSTSILSLLQSGLPLDLVKGGIYREPLNETFSGIILAFQLCLLLGLQWPIGRWLSKKDVSYGLKLSLVSLSLGCLLLSISSLLSNGIIIVLISLVLIALGLTSFLPTATESIVRVSSISNRGIAMALFSQCFGVSSIIAPITSGQIIDKTGNGLLLWLIMFILGIACLPLTNQVKLVK